MNEAQIINIYVKTDLDKFVTFIHSDVIKWANERAAWNPKSGHKEQKIRFHYIYFFKALNCLNNLQIFRKNERTIKPFNSIQYGTQENCQKCSSEKKSYSVLQVFN